MLEENNTAVLGVCSPVKMAIPEHDTSFCTLLQPSGELIGPKNRKGRALVAESTDHGWRLLGCQTACPIALWYGGRFTVVKDKVAQ